MIIVDDSKGSFLAGGGVGVGRGAWLSSSGASPSLLTNPRTYCKHLTQTVYIPISVFYFCVVIILQQTNKSPDPVQYY